MPRSRLLLAVISVLVLSACASEKADVNPATASATPATTWTLQYDAGTPVRMAANVSGVFLAGNTAIFPFSDRTRGGAYNLGSLDLTTGKRTLLARTGFPGGTIVSAVQVGGEVVYLDESARGNLTPGAARWRVIALHSHRLLASSGSRRVTMSPDLSVIDGSTVWTTYADQGGGYRTFGWKPGGKVQRRDALPGDENECTPPASSAERVAGCDLRGGWIAWVETDNRDLVVDDDHPAQLFYARADGGDEHLIGQTFSEGSPPVILGDYLVWERNDRVTITSLEHPTAATEVPTDPHTSSTFYGADDARRIAWVSQQDNETTLQVIEADGLRLTSSVLP